MYASIKISTGYNYGGAQEQPRQFGLATFTYLLNSFTSALQHKSTNTDIQNSFLW